jgi:hypothetical protein
MSSRPHHRGAAPVALAREGRRHSPRPVARRWATASPEHQVTKGLWELWVLKSNKIFRIFSGLAM